MPANTLLSGKVMFTVTIDYAFNIPFSGDATQLITTGV
jgi:hypothetical protein